MLIRPGMVAAGLTVTQSRSCAKSSAGESWPNGDVSVTGATWPCTVYCTCEPTKSSTEAIGVCGCKSMLSVTAWLYDGGGVAGALAGDAPPAPPIVCGACIGPIWR